MGRARLLLLLSVQVCLWILFITHNTRVGIVLSAFLPLQMLLREREGKYSSSKNDSIITPPQQMRATIGVVNFDPNEAFLTEENGVSQLRNYTQ